MRLSYIPVFMRSKPWPLDASDEPAFSDRYLSCCPRFTHLLSFECGSSNCISSSYFPPPSFRWVWLWWEYFIEIGYEICKLCPIFYMWNIIIVTDLIIYKRRFIVSWMYLAQQLIIYLFCYSVAINAIPAQLGVIPFPA